MAKEKELTFFGLNLQGVHSNEDPEKFKKLDSHTQEFIIGIYSPIMAELEAIYKESPQTNSSEMQHIAEAIKEQLRNRNFSEDQISQLSNIKQEFSSANGSIDSYLKFILQSIENSKNISEIIEGYTYEGKKRTGLAKKVEGMFVRDFERTPFKLIDQNNDIISENFNTRLLEELKKSNIKINRENICNKLKSAINATDQQLKLIVSRYNQRSIQSAGIAFVTSGAIEKQESREDILYVDKQKDGSLKLKALEHKATMQKPIIGEDGNILEKKDINQVSYYLDISGLQENDSPGELFLALPTQLVPEILIYKSLCEEGNYELPDCLDGWITPQGFMQHEPIIHEGYFNKGNSVEDSFKEGSLREYSPKTVTTSGSSDTLSYLLKFGSTLISNAKELIVGEKIGDIPLKPSELNAKLSKELKEIKAYNLKEDTNDKIIDNNTSKTPPLNNVGIELNNVGIESDSDDEGYCINRSETESLKANSFLFYKEKQDSVIFVTEACNDVDRATNPNKFALSGGFSVGDKLQEVMDTDRYKAAKDLDKKIEIYMPMALTRGNLLFDRAHWITINVIEKNNSMDVIFMDSLHSALGYNFKHIEAEIKEIGGSVLLKKDVKKSYSFEYKTRADQGFSDHSSCGYYVTKYIIQHVEEEYRKRPVGMERKKEGTEVTGLNPVIHDVKEPRPNIVQKVPPSETKQQANNR